MNTLAIIPGMQGGGEVLLVIFIILLLFGAKKLPEIARSIGKSRGEFNKGLREGEESEKKESETKAIADSDEPEKKDDKA